MQNLTPVDEFTEPVRGVQNTDAPTATNINEAPQGVLNRTEFLRNRCGVVCHGEFVADASVATGDSFEFDTFASVSNTPLDFTLASATQIQVPADGVYRVDFHAYLSSDDAATPNLPFTVGVYKAALQQRVFAAQRANADASSRVSIVGFAILNITDADTQYISVRLTGSVGTCNLHTGSYAVQRIG